MESHVFAEPWLHGRHRASWQRAARRAPTSRRRRGYFPRHCRRTGAARVCCRALRCWAGLPPRRCRTAACWTCPSPTPSTGAETYSENLRKPEYLKALLATGCKHCEPNDAAMTLCLSSAVYHAADQPLSYTFQRCVENWTTLVHSL